MGYFIQTSSIKYVDDTFSLQPFVDPSLFNDFLESSSSQQESTINNNFSSLPHREPITSSSSQRETITLNNSSDPVIASSTSTTTSSTTRPGWNASHRYETRFKRHFVANIATPSSFFDTPIDSTLHAALLAAQDYLFPDIPSASSFLHNVSYAAKSNPDVLHFGQMQKDPDRSSFEKDMRRELSDLVASDTVEITPRSSFPFGTRVLQAIWSFRQKRAPDWSILKHKARICPHDGEQVEGLNYWDTYAPAVSWHTVRLVLVLSLLADLKSRQIDYVNAFTQAPADCDIFMNIPIGFIVKNGTLHFTTDSTKNNSCDFVLRIKKNMYGLKQAGNNWFDALKTSLLKHGFTQSSYDPCLFICGNCILVVYVDDCLLFAKSDSILDDLVTSLKNDFVLTSSGTVGAFLGIDIHRTADGFLELVQPGFIKKIIAVCGLQDSSMEHHTPATDILHSDSSGPPRKHHWNYRSLIGMLTYLSTSTHPDKAFAVHQCANLVLLQGVFINLLCGALCDIKKVPVIEASSCVHPLP